MGRRFWIVLVLLGMLPAACTGSSSAPSATERSGRPTTVATAPAPVSSRQRVSRSVSAGVRVGPWGARTVGGVGGRDLPLAGDRDSLYVSHGSAILRLDPASGDVLARRAVGSAAPPQAVIVADRLWTAYGASGGTVIVRGLTLDTLTPVTSITLRMSATAAPIDQIALDAAISDGRLYVGVRNTVWVIDANTHRVLHQFQAHSGSMADLAVSPDDTRLYVTSDVANSMLGRMKVLDPDTGAATMQAITLDGGTGFGGIAASAGGAWLQTGSGMSDWLAFRPSSDLAQAGPPLTYAGGGFVTTSTVTGHVVWVGGTTRLACADPRTGSVRAAARVPTPHGDAANISRITAAGNRLFAYYLAGAGPSRLLIALHPPARCRT